MPSKHTVLITGASTGIDAAYADRFAKRGHDLVLVARGRTRMETLADCLRRDTGISVDIVPADLTDPRDLTKVEARLRDDARIGVLVNNALASAPGEFLNRPKDDLTRIISLKTAPLARLASAVAPQFAKSGEGPIINISSVVALAPEYGRQAMEPQSLCSLSQSGAVP